MRAEPARLADIMLSVRNGDIGYTERIPIVNSINPANLSQSESPRIRALVLLMKTQIELKSAQLSGPTRILGLLRPI